MPRILIVEDEPEIREMVRFVLETEGFSLSEASHACEARNILAKSSFDLILMDWMLPGRSGLEFVRELKQKSSTRDMPLIMLTARADEPDRVEGLDSGADDYIIKPFSPRELIARIRAVLRRSGKSLEPSAAPVEAGGLRIDTSGHQVSVDGSKLELSPSEYKLLHFFMTHQERAFSRAQILDQVWGKDSYIEERTVDVHIRRLRKLLIPSRYDRCIQTVRGVGYRFTRVD